jgi:hypothetical protein
VDPAGSVHQILCKSREKRCRDSGNYWTSVRKRKHEPYTENPNTQFEKDKTVERACSSFSLASTRLFTNNSSWQAKESISHNAVVFYGYCLRMCEDYATKFGDKGTSGCITTTHRLTLLFSPGNILIKSNMTIVHTHLTFLVFPIEDNTEMSPF